MQLSHFKFQVAKLKTLYSTFLKNGEIFTDFMSLGLLQSLNLFIPLLLVPYLIKVYGVEKYGWIAICQAFANYLIIFTDYGFNLTAVREVSISRKNVERLSSIYTSVTIIKFFLFASVVLLLFLARAILPQFETALNYLILSSFGIAFQILFPIWLFQGLGKIKLGTGLLLAGKLFHAALIFLIISKTSSLNNFFYLQCISYFLVIIIGIIVVNRKYHIRFGDFEKREISYHFREGWHVYISNISINVYTGSSTLILGAFQGPRAAAIFGIADQVLSLLRQPISIFIRVIYPKACLLAVEGGNKVNKLLKEAVIPLAVIYVIVCSVIFIFAKQISAFFSKESFEEVSVLVRILCFVPLPVLLLNTPPYLVFLAHRMDNINSKVIIKGAVLGLVSNLLLSYFFSSAGSAVSVVVTELFVGISLSVILKNKFSFESLF